MIYCKGNFHREHFPSPEATYYVALRAEKRLIAVDKYKRQQTGVFRCELCAKRAARLYDNQIYKKGTPEWEAAVVRHVTRKLCR